MATEVGFEGPSAALAPVPREVTVAKAMKKRAERLRAIKELACPKHSSSSPK
jgi:hypothetical protein